MKRLLPVFLLFLSGLCYGRTTLELTLGETVAAAINHSPALKALKAGLDSKRAGASSLESLLYPRVLLEGSFKYQSEVQEMTLALPGADKTVKLGDNWNMSAGPSAYYTLFDKGADEKNYKASLASLKAAEKEYEAEKRSVELAARMAYFDLKLALERISFLEDAVSVVKSQYEEIKLKSKAGLSARQDELRAHQELNSRLIDLINARSAFARSFRELAALCGKWGEVDPAAALPAGAGSAAGTPATLYISLEPAEELLKKIFLSGKTVDGHPSLLSMEESVRALRLLSESLGAGLWPRANLALRSSLDYPDGTKTSSHWQNSASLSISVPLFERGKTKSREEEQKLKAFSAEELKNGWKNELEKGWLNAKDRLLSLLSRKKLMAENAAESEEVAGLVYASYRSGSSTYLEVQSANLKALESRLLKAENDISALAQTAVLAALEGE